MRVTEEEALLLKLRFNEFVNSLIGEDVAVQTTVGEFHIEQLRKPKHSARVIRETSCWD